MANHTPIIRPDILQSQSRADYNPIWQDDKVARLAHTCSIQTLTEETVMTIRSGRTSK